MTQPVVFFRPRDIRRSFLLALLLVANPFSPLSPAACSGDDDDDNPPVVTDDDDDGPVNPERPAYNEWLKVEPEGAVCGNNTQYKFFINYSETSDNVLFVLEPGGACWDFDSCSGRTRGAANPDGIPDDHMVGPWAIHTPLFLREWGHWMPGEDVRTSDWNFVFIPYCTGDIHAGNNVITYPDPQGLEPDITFHHNGHNNVQKVIDWVGQQFPALPELMVAGCSAGGTGSLANYYFFRKGLPQTQRGYMLNDSGPIFPEGASGYSKPLHDKVRLSWNVDSYLPQQFDWTDFGNISLIVADEFPHDRLGITYFRRDYNYSLYSYESFYNYPDKGEIHRMWWEDTKLLMTQYDTRDNLAYYIPYFRSLNDSHCVMIVSYTGTEIQEKGVNLSNFIQNILDDSQPLQSYLETPQPNEDQPQIEYDY